MPVTFLALESVLREVQPWVLLAKMCYVTLGCLLVSVDNLVLELTFGLGHKRSFE